MPKHPLIKINQTGIKQILNDPEITKTIEHSIAPELISLFERLYPGSKWESEIRQIKGRKTVVIKTDSRDVPFREANSGRIRKALRRKISHAQPIRKSDAE